MGGSDCGRIDEGLQRWEEHLEVSFPFAYPITCCFWRPHGLGGKRVILESEGQALGILALSLTSYVSLGSSQSLGTSGSTSVKLGCGGISEVVPV